MPIAVQYPGPMNSPTRSRAQAAAPQHNSPPRDLDDGGPNGYHSNSHRDHPRSAAPPAQRFSTHDDFYDFLDSNRGPASNGNDRMSPSSPQRDSVTLPRQPQVNGSSRPPVSTAIPSRRPPSYTYSDSQSEDMLTAKSGAPPSPAEVAAAAKGMNMMPSSGRNSAGGGPPPGPSSLPISNGSNPNGAGSSSRRPVPNGAGHSSKPSMSGGRPSTSTGGSPTNNNGYRTSSGYPEQRYGNNAIPRGPPSPGPGPDSIPQPGTSIPLNNQMDPITGPPPPLNNNANGRGARDRYHHQQQQQHHRDERDSRDQQQAASMREQIQRLKSPSVMSCVLQPLDQKVREYDDHMARERDEMARLDEEIRLLQRRRDDTEQRYLDAKDKHDEYHRQYIDVERALRGEAPAVPALPAGIKGAGAGAGAGAPQKGGAPPPHHDDFDDDDLDEDDLDDLDDMDPHRPGNHQQQQQRQNTAASMGMQQNHRRAQSQQSFGASSGKMRTRDRLRISLFGER